MFLLNLIFSFIALRLPRAASARELRGAGGRQARRERHVPLPRRPGHPQPRDRLLPVVPARRRRRARGVPRRRVRLRPVPRRLAGEQAPVRLRVARGEGRAPRGLAMQAEPRERARRRRRRAAVQVRRGRSVIPSTCTDHQLPSIIIDYRCDNDE